MCHVGDLPAFEHLAELGLTSLLHPGQKIARAFVLQSPRKDAKNEALSGITHAKIKKMARICIAVKKWVMWDIMIMCLYSRSLPDWSWPQKVQPRWLTMLNIALYSYIAKVVIRHNYRDTSDHCSWPNTPKHSIPIRPIRPSDLRSALFHRVSPSRASDGCSWRYAEAAASLHLAACMAAWRVMWMYCECWEMLADGSKMEQNGARTNSSHTVHIDSLLSLHFPCNISWDASNVECWQPSAKKKAVRIKQANTKSVELAPPRYTTSEVHKIATEHWAFLNTQGIPTSQVTSRHWGRIVYRCLSHVLLFRSCARRRLAIALDAVRPAFSSSLRALYSQHKRDRER